MNPKFRILLAILAWLVVCVGGSMFCSSAFVGTFEFNPDKALWIETELVAFCSLLGYELMRRNLNTIWPRAVVTI